MIQQLYFWVYRWKNWKQGPEQVCAHPWLQQHYLRQPEVGATEVSTNGRTHKWNGAENIIRPWKKEILTSATTWVDPKWKKPVTKRLRLYDSTYRRHLARPQSQGQQAEWWLPGWVCGATIYWAEVQFCKMKSFGNELTPMNGTRKNG